MQHNQLREATALIASLSRALGERDGDWSGLERAGETLTPVIDLWSLPEWAALRAEALWAVFFSQGKVAAEKGLVAIINLSTSRSIVTVESVYARTADAAGTFNWFIATEAVITAQEDAGGGVNVRDRRLVSAAGTFLLGQVRVSRGGSAGIAANNLGNWTTIGATSQAVHFSPVILRPGEALCFEHGTINLDIAVGVNGRMRPALAGELE